MPRCLYLYRAVAVFSLAAVVVRQRRLIGILSTGRPLAFETPALYQGILGVAAARMSTREDGARTTSQRLLRLRASAGRVQSSILSARRRGSSGGRDFVGALNESSWSSENIAGAMERLLLRWSGGRPIRVAAVGGSASAGKVTYLNRFVGGLRDVLCGANATTTTTTAAAAERRCSGDVVAINPSSGRTGSVWAATHLDALVPRDTDILLWEFVINDWDGPPREYGLSRTVWMGQAFELFVRRAIGLNPNIVIGIVSLWQVRVRRCWPGCRNDAAPYRALLGVAERYGSGPSGIPIFALDFNRMAKTVLTKEELLADYHHPKVGAHMVIGDALLLHVLLHMASGAEPSSLPPPPHDVIDPSSLPNVTFSESDLASCPVLAALMDVRRHVSCLYYGVPTFGESMNEIEVSSGGRLEKFGKASEERNDRKLHVRIPPCNDDEGGGNPSLALRIDRARNGGGPIEVVGINLRGPEGGMDVEGSDSLGEDVRVAVDGVRFVLQTDKGHGMQSAGALRRGWSDPQAWWRSPDAGALKGLGRDSGQPMPVGVQVCVERGYNMNRTLGALVFL